MVTLSKLHRMTYQMKIHMKYTRRMCAHTIVKMEIILQLEQKQQQQEQQQ